MTKSLKSLAGATFIATLIAAAPFAANAQEFTLKIQSSDAAGVPNFELEQEWAERVETMTGGRVDVEMLPVNSIVEHNETQDAIAAGILDGHITDTSYFTGKDPAFGLIANPVGAWLAHGRHRPKCCALLSMVAARN